MKTLLLDIDNTLLHHDYSTGVDTPRPYLKEFLERMSKQYDIRFYTAARCTRITDLCRVLIHKLGMQDQPWIRKANRSSLGYDNCPMIAHQTGPVSEINIKCLRKAATVLRIPYEDIAYILDDMPMHDNPDQEKRIQVPGFWGQENDTYLRDLVLP